MYGEGLREDFMISGLGVCPAGEKAFIDAVSQDPKECRSTVAKDECPPGYMCRQNGPNKFYCCSPAVSGECGLVPWVGELEATHFITAYCPPGRTLFRDSTTRQPQACDVGKESGKNACPLGYSCYAPKAEKTRGFCCAIDVEFKKDNSISSEFL